MRLKKSMLNVLIALISYVISFIPIIIIRKVFINTLGVEMLGLSSIYANILGYLSIVEMGIGSAIIYSLYKPFKEKNGLKISGYIKYYELFYKKVGILVFLLGIVIAPNIGKIFNTEIDNFIVIGGFILFLINTVIGYMFTYKHCIFNAAQENYKLTIALTISKIIIAIFQIFVLIKFNNFFIYLLIQIIVNLIMYIMLNKYIHNKYNWIFCKEGSLTLDEEKDLKKNIKALFFHKIGLVFVFGTDNIVLSYFTNLKTVAIYNNYLIIINALNGLISSAMISITGSIGNLITSTKKEYIYDVFKRILFLNFWTSSFICITTFNTINHFISIWIGNEYFLDEFSIFLIIINMYFQMTRATIDRFKEASGQYYKDRYAPLIEGIINLVFSIILVKRMGLSGVLMGTLISNFFVVFWIKPFIVYKYLFKKPVKLYFKIYFKNIIINIIPLIITAIISSYISKYETLNMFIVNCLTNLLIINSYYILIYRKNLDYIYFKNLILAKLNFNIKFIENIKYKNKL